MSDVFVALAEKGEYSERQVWPVRVFTDESAGRDFVVRAERQSRTECESECESKGWGSWMMYGLVTRYHLEQTPMTEAADICDPSSPDYSEDLDRLEAELEYSDE